MTIGAMEVWIYILHNLILLEFLDESLPSTIVPGHDLRPLVIVRSENPLDPDEARRDDKVNEGHCIAHEELLLQTVLV